ncbi:MAG: hypothetical protein JXR33_02680 [Coriobacteriia bacterium]|nr:hypothetical protein [Coriobacteriia bacterium]
MRRAVWMTLFLALLLSVPAFAMAEEHTVSPHIPLSENSPSSTELVELPDIFDGTTVVYRGEVIGEAMVRGNWAWLHLNDDAYMERNIEEGAPLGGLNSGMPVWVPAPEVAQIGVFGDYRHEGDIVEVRGVFNAACAEHGGDMDIHAVHLTVIRAGREVDDPVSNGKLWTAIVVILAAAGVYLLDRNLDRIREWLAR